MNRSTPVSKLYRSAFEFQKWVEGRFGRITPGLSCIGRSGISGLSISLKTPTWGLVTRLGDFAPLSRTREVQTIAYTAGEIWRLLSL